MLIHHMGTSTASVSASRNGDLIRMTASMIHGKNAICGCGPDHAWTNGEK